MSSNKPDVDIACRRLAAILRLEAQANRNLPSHDPSDEYTATDKMWTEAYLLGVTTGLEQAANHIENYQHEVNPNAPPLGDR